MEGQPRRPRAFFRAGDGDVTTRLAALKSGRVTHS